MLEAQNETDDVFHMIRERNGPHNKIIFVKSIFFRPIHMHLIKSIQVALEYTRGVFEILNLTDF